MVGGDDALAGYRSVHSVPFRAAGRLLRQAAQELRREAPSFGNPALRSWGFPLTIRKIQI